MKMMRASGRRMGVQEEASKEKVCVSNEGGDSRSSDVSAALRVLDVSCGANHRLSNSIARRWSNEPHDVPTGLRT